MCLWPVKLSSFVVVVVFVVVAVVVVIIVVVVVDFLKVEDTVLIIHGTA